jgi:uncharacterized protein YuzE
MADRRIQRDEVECAIRNHDARKETVSGKIKFCKKFEVELDRHGKPLAVYIRIRNHKVHRSEKLGDGEVILDLGSRGEIVGIEIVEPCRAAILERVASEHKEPSIRTLVHGLPMLQPA